MKKLVLIAALLLVSACETYTEEFAKPFDCSVFGAGVGAARLTT